MLKRDMVAILRETKYDIGANKFLTHIRNINVLIGWPQEIDTVKPEVEGFLKSIGAPYKSEWRIQRF